MHEIKVYSAAGKRQSNGVSRANIRRDAPARRGARPKLVHVEETTVGRQVEEGQRTVSRDITLGIHELGPDESG